MKRIAVLTSGGDAPGMNAGIRAVVRTALHEGLEVWGIKRGYQGMIDDSFTALSSSDVSNIIQRGGTILGSARSPEFFHKEGRAKAYKNLKKYGIEGVVVIGGDGSFTGADVFMQEYRDIAFVGMPGTIDNDLYGTDFTIGYDTAINTAMQAIDKIKDTAAAHNRLFFVEVMGRDAGFIAIHSGIATGAESVLVPESRTDLDALIDLLLQNLQNKKMSNIVVVAEGDDAGSAYEIMHKIRPQLEGFDIRVTVLGHLQRGGSPTCMDRVLASRLGVAAVKALLMGKRSIMLGLHHRKVQEVPFEQAIKHNGTFNPYWEEIARILSV